MQYKISETKSDSTVPRVLSTKTVLFRGNNPEFSMCETSNIAEGSVGKNG